MKCEKPLWNFIEGITTNMNRISHWVIKHTFATSPMVCELTFAPKSFCFLFRGFLKDSVKGSLVDGRRGAWERTQPRKSWISSCWKKKCQIFKIVSASNNHGSKLIQLKKPATTAGKLKKSLKQLLIKLELLSITTYHPYLYQSIVVWLNQEHWLYLLY